MATFKRAFILPPSPLPLPFLMSPGSCGLRSTCCQIKNYNLTNLAPFSRPFPLLAFLGEEFEKKPSQFLAMTESKQRLPWPFSSTQTFSPHCKHQALHLPIPALLSFHLLACHLNRVERKRTLSSSLSALFWVRPLCKWAWPPTA